MYSRMTSLPLSSLILHFEHLQSIKVQGEGRFAPFGEINLPKTGRKHSKGSIQMLKRTWPLQKPLPLFLYWAYFPFTWAPNSHERWIWTKESRCNQIGCFGFDRQQGSVYFAKPIVQVIAQGLDLRNSQHSRLHPRYMNCPLDLIDDSLNKVNLVKDNWLRLLSKGKKKLSKYIVNYIRYKYNIKSGIIFTCANEKTVNHQWAHMQGWFITFFDDAT